ncbi:MAG: hypothetical protein M0P58_06080 [Bacteroidales bacterium]|nr:hypothetical protein [Bacteroidales bacterium]
MKFYYLPTGIKERVKREIVYLLNKGFNGGTILAVRDGIPNFELVGLVKSISTKREYVLCPRNDMNVYYNDIEILYI